jgi:putative hemolysin
MVNPVFEIILVLALILANGFFSMLETALVSARRVRLQQRSEDGDSKARAALKLIETPNTFLSTLQIGITLIGILSGAVGGATLSQELAVLLARIPGLAPSSQTLALILVVLIITYFSLVLGELIPKRLALNGPERIASTFSGSMRFLQRLVAPLIFLLSVSTDLGLRLLGVKPSSEPPVTEEEVKTLIEQGTQVGIFAEAEQDMVAGVFRLGERRVDALMKPRTEMVWLDLEDPLEQLVQKVIESHYSRFPVAEDNLDNVVGVLLSKDLLANRIVDESLDIRALLRAPLFVPESTPALKVLEMFRHSGGQMALVIDEYGGLQGMVTLYDILEAIVGEISTLDQPHEPGALQREDGSWLFDGMLPIDEFKEALDLGDLPEENHAGYQTVGGFMMSVFGAIPTTGQHFEWHGLHFEVVDMDGRRVDKVLVAPAGSK